MSIMAGLSFLGMFKKEGDFLLKIPWQVYAVVAIGIAFQIHGCNQFERGEKHADAQWEKARQEIISAAEHSNDATRIAAASRAKEFQEEVSREKEKLDEARENGDSTFDVFFGTE